MNSMVVAYGRHREIGAHGDLPWGRDLPADLEHFRKLTRGRSVIMGRATFESIGSRPLPDRQNIVVTSRPTGVENVLSAQSLVAAFALAQYDPVVIGGVGLFEEALQENLIDTIYATEVDHEFADADRFFPTLDDNTWQPVAREHHAADERNAYDMDFVTYKRV